MIKKLPEREIFSALVVILVASLGYGWYMYSGLQEENEGLRVTIVKLEDRLGITEENLALTEEVKEGLSSELEAEKEKVGSLAEDIQDIAGTVGILDKLSKTDEELLQKYSKVYFLNEHYVPDKLTDIPLTHLYNESVVQYIHTNVWPYLEDMIENAADDGITLWINSAYRSFGQQSALKAAYSITYGSGANAFSADQGYSEHQLGTTVDLTTMGIGGGYEGFGDTPAYQWLLDNAHKYGFTLSYPENNSYYTFEPWHWRFVGVELAKDLHREDNGFYDVDQRKINEYLIKIFD